MTNLEAKLTVTGSPSEIVTEDWGNGVYRPTSVFADGPDEAKKMEEALNILIQYAIANI